MFPYTTATDFELTDLMKSGDHSAFAELYGRYNAVLYLHVKRMLNSEDETKDLVQEVFVKMWQNRNELNITSSVKSYLYTVTRNKVFNVFAHKKFELNYLNSLQQIIDEGENDLEENLREKELIEIIEREIDLLPTKMREVFEMSRKQHLSHKEIAEKLNISDKTVKKQIGNAIKILRPKIKAIVFAFPSL